MRIEDCEIFVEEVNDEYTMNIILPQDLSVLDRLNLFAVVTRRIAKMLEAAPIDMPHSVAMWMMGQFILQEKPVEVILKEIMEKTK